MNKNAILKNIEELSNDAMFSLSLTSRELFHTNFWAWLLRKYRRIFTSVFYPNYDGKSNVEVLREKYNFDLLLKINDEYIIIENKCKSVPNRVQLKKYYKKFKTDKKKIVLVSYFTPLFLSTLFDYEEFLSYEELYSRLKNAFYNISFESIEKIDKVLIESYIDFLALLNEFQTNITINADDKIKDLWSVVRDTDIQNELYKINFQKSFERTYIIKLTEKVLENFRYKEFIDDIRIDCGRDLKMFSDILFYFPGAWDKDENKRQDLCYLGVSLWGDEYRYYAGLHKIQCGIFAPKKDKYDKENKNAGFKYLSENYSWLFEQEDTCKWNGYSYEKEMYLYKKLDISNLTVKELAKKVVHDLELIYFYLEARRGRECKD